MNKKFLAKLLIFCLVFTMLPVSAFAADVDAVDGNDGYTLSLDVNPKDVTLSIGGTQNITANLTYKTSEDSTPIKIGADQYDLVLTSSDTSIATVNGTTITGVKDGKTTINAVATLKDGSGQKGEATINVIVNPAGKVTVTYDGNKPAAATGEVTGLPSSTQATVGTTFTLDTQTKPTLTGYTFKGWGETAQATVAVAEIAIPKDSQGVTVYAIWEAVIPTIDTVTVVPNKLNVEVKDGKISVTGAVGEDEASKGVVVTIVDSLGKEYLVNISYANEKFTAEPATVKIGNTTYAVETGLKIEKAVVVAPEASAGFNENAPEDVQPVLADVAAVLEDTSIEGAEKIVAAAKTEDENGNVTVAGTEITKQQIDDVAKGLGSSYDAVTILVVPRLDLVAKNATKDESNNIATLVFEIKLFADVRVTTNAANMDDTNTKTVKEDIEIDANDKPVTITLPLPTTVVNLDNTPNDKMFVRHKKTDKSYVYRANRAETVNGVTFINPHGFSEFTLELDANYVANINNGNHYATLQEAVNAVENGDTIYLIAPDTVGAEVNKTVKFEVALATGVTGVTAKITPASGYKTGENHNVNKDTGLGTYDIVRDGGGTTGGGGGSSSSNVTIASKVTGGTVSISPSRPNRGQTVTINVKPATGYKLDTLTVTDKDGNKLELTKVSDDKYTFVMPAGKVTVTPTFVKTDSTEKPGTSTGLTFSDVKADAWYAEYIAYVVEKGMMNGYEDGRFGPNDSTTRAQIVTVLYRLEGEPATSSASFRDVSGGQYYSNAVAWAANNGIVNGYETGAFGPSDNVTREQIAAILYRYAEYKEYDVTATGNVNSFSDSAKVSSWATDAMNWAIGEGLINGDNGALRPQGNATRAEIATLLTRFCENIAK